MAASVYYNVYNSPLQGGQLNNDYTAFDLNFSNSFVLGKKGWSAELNSFYQSKNAWGLFIIKDLAQVTAGLAKTTHNRKSTFKLSVSDLFTTNHIAVIVQYQNMDFLQIGPGIVGWLPCLGHIGLAKPPSRRARQRSTGVEEEKEGTSNG
ncbi:MAG: outer membrane beta-barrel protein [Saprospiraceae bacterium]|nr:outer membrane beta-barrel protein [Saprospiraceae bacterium]